MTKIIDLPCFAATKLLAKSGGEKGFSHNRLPFRNVAIDRTNSDFTHSCLAHYITSCYFYCNTRNTVVQPINV